MRLEIDLIEDPADGAGADGRDDAVEDGLAGQILTGPVGDVQALGDRLQAGQFDDLGPLEGGKSGRGVPIGVGGPAARSAPTARSDGRSARRWPRRTASGRRRPWSAPRRRWPARCGHGGPDTRARTRSGRSAGGSGHHRGRWRWDEVFVRASGLLLDRDRERSPAYHSPRIPRTTYGQGH